MRKLTIALPAAALMISSLAAAQTQPQQTTNLEQNLQVNVTNVCTYKVDDRTDVNGKTYYGGNLLVINYKATAESTGTTTPDYEYRCTAGTNFAQANISSAVIYSPSATASDDLNTPQGPEFTAEVVNFAKTSNAAGSNVGDTYKFAIKLTAKAGQFGVPAGTYNGIIKTTVNYN